MNKILRQYQLTPYERDYARWCAEQAALLRRGTLEALDRENLAEEVEGLGRSERKEIRKRLRVLLVHLLKWQYQARKRKPGWKATILVQRRELLRAVTESPSLRNYPFEVIAEAYEAARLKAAGETNLDEGIFPTECPFSIEQVLDVDWLPDAD